MTTFKNLTGVWSLGSNWDLGVPLSGATATVNDSRTVATVDKNTNTLGSLNITAGRIDVGTSFKLTTGSLTQGGGIVFTNGGTLQTNFTLTQTGGGFYIGTGLASIASLNQTGGVIGFTGSGTLQFTGASGLSPISSSSAVVDLGKLNVLGTVFWNNANTATLNRLTLKNFWAGDKLRVLTSSTANLSWQYSGDAFSGAVTLKSGASVLGVVNVADVNGGLAQPGVFTLNSGGTYVELGSTAPCFLRGTRIATPRGELAVEDLRIGDLLVTATGPQPIRWIGTRSYVTKLVPADCRAGLMPIRIAAGALGGGCPVRDLFVSPEHMMCIGDVLVPAHCLVNGATITRVTALDVVQYFHVELPRHDVIRAEGAPTESYRDTANRNMFANVLSCLAVVRPEDDVLPAPCRPVVTDGPALEAVRAALSDQATVVRPATRLTA